MQVCVLGAGVVGLTTALELQKTFRDSQVTIIANQFNEETTSHVAAGVFRPGTSFQGPTEEITKKWIEDAFEHWDEIRLTSEAPLAGVTQLSGYIFSNLSPAITRNQLMEKVVPVYRQATTEELQLCPGNWKYGSFFTTVLTECSRYLPWAGSKFTQGGGRFLKQTVNTFSELAGKYDIVVNCTGLQSQTLCNDRMVVPIRGQIIKVKAPWLKTAFYGDYDTYILPGFETVTLGGVRQFESYNMEVCRHDSAAIRERCEALLPSLKGAQVVKELVGLRPYRGVVRVEKEVLLLRNNQIKIVHNYGHGGYGVTTSPGTAKYAVKLVNELLRANSKL